MSMPNGDYTIEPDEKLSDLLNIGFVYMGEWQLHDQLSIEWHESQETLALLDSKPALYAFAENGILKYVGKTAKKLKERLKQYVNPGNSQSTNIKCNKNIRRALDNDNIVQVFGFSPDACLQYGKFGISIPAGLEDALIKELAPLWNGTQGNRNHLAMTESEANENDLDESPKAEPPLSDNVSKNIGSFDLDLKTSAYSSGTINVPKSVDYLLGSHLEPCRIYLGFAKSDPIIKKITRRANSNGTARINGGTDVANWLKQKFTEDSFVHVAILDRNRVLLQSPQS